MRYLLFAGQDYYPAGGALDCIGAYEYSHEPGAIEWAEQFDVDAGSEWDHPDWMHLARIDGDGLTIVRKWTRDYELVPAEGGGHRRLNGPWDVDEVAGE